MISGGFGVIFVTWNMYVLQCTYRYVEILGSPRDKDDKICESKNYQSMGKKEIETQF